jgi:hypothetical protein
MSYTGRETGSGTDSGPRDDQKMPPASRRACASASPARASESGTLSLVASAFRFCAAHARSAAVSGSRRVKMPSPKGRAGLLVRQVGLTWGGSGR